MQITIRKAFKNLAAPAYFTNWAIRNLEATSDKDQFADAVRKNIREYGNHESAKEIKTLLTNFMTELDEQTHSDLLSHYRLLAKASAKSA